MVTARPGKARAISPSAGSKNVSSVVRVRPKVNGASAPVPKALANSLAAAALS